MADAVARGSARARPRGRGGRHRRRDRLRRRQPAGPHARPGGRAHDPAVRAPRHRAARRAGGGRARRRAWSRNRNEAILGADNKAAVATILGAARRFAAEGPPVGLELLFTTCEELALRGAKAFDRNRLTADFGFVFDHASPIGELIVAAPTYYRIEANIRGTAAHAGIRPEDGRNAIAAAARGVASMKLGRHRRRDDRERRAASRAAPPATWWPSAAAWSSRRAASTTRAPAWSWARWSTRSPRRRATPSATSRPPSSACSAATASSAPRRRSRWPRPRCEAAGIEPSYVTDGRRERRQRADRRRAADAEPRQRHRAQPPARRVGDGRRARADARRDCRHRRRKRRVAWRAMAFERIGSETSTRGGSPASATTASATRTAARASARSSATRARSGSWRTTASGSTSSGSRARRSNEPALLELPAGKLDEEGEDPLETAKRELAEEIGKGARHWEHITTLLHLARVRRRGGAPLPRHRPLRRPRRVGRGRADRDRRGPARRPGRRDRRQPRLQDADRAALVQGVPGRADRRVAAGGDGGPASESLCMATVARADSRHARTSTSCSTSSPISSSSAGSRATRSRRTAPTCSSSAASSRSATPPRSTPTSRDVSDFLTGLAAGNGNGKPASPATVHRKAACLRSFYRHLRREGVRDSDPAASLSPPRRGPQAAAGADPRRGGAAAEPAEGYGAGGAARPRAARADVRVRPARVGGDRAAGGRRRPGGPACCGRAARARRSGSCRSAPAAATAVRIYLERGRPGLVEGACEPHLFVNFRGGDADPPGPLQDRAPPRARPPAWPTG